MNSNFSFLEITYPELHKLALIAEQLISVDPSSSLGKTRLFSEKLAKLVQDFEYIQDDHITQVERIRMLYECNAIPEAIKDILHTIRKSGNKATHDGNSSYQEALYALKKAFKLSRWFYETYENETIETSDYQLPTRETSKTVQNLESELENLTNKVKDYETKIKAFNASANIKEERKIRSFANANNIAKSEAETRDLIDEQLRQAGWECDTQLLNFKINKTLPEKGKNKAIAEWKCGSKWADYALFVGLELYGIVEAKKYATDISTNLDQSKMYASLVQSNTKFNFLGEWHSYKVPFLFSTNGRSYLEQLHTKSGIWFLDIRNQRNKAKALRGWYSPSGLEELYKRDLNKANNKLKQASSDFLTNKNGLSLREYQIKAIDAVEKKILSEKERKALLVMATGTGKTRTIIGLCYRLIKANRFKRILFLTDRRLLAEQAENNFSDNKIEDINTFGNIYKIEGLKQALPDSDTRIHFATVQSMVHRLFHGDSGEKMPIDTYDCIIIDEAHRGYNLDKELDEYDLQFKNENDYISQYKRVIQYFDAFNIGLTATPALHTKEIFGSPTFTYSYREAVTDGFLVDHAPPYTIKTKLSEEGILWEAGEKPKVFIAETNSIEELEELEDELKIEIEQFNKMVITDAFNREIIKYLVKQLDPESDEKTLIFAVRDSHADLIVKLFYEEYENIGIDVPHNAIQKITGNVNDQMESTRLFKNEKFPNIAVTVDLLTTGIDVPKITNLVFLRRVRSRILFEQMVGRATRLCDEINKTEFKIYDAVRVYEAIQDYTQMKPVANPSTTFTQLVNELDFIDDPKRAIKQVNQIIAKLQRKKRLLGDDQNYQFAYLSQGLDPDEFIKELKTLDENDDIKGNLNQYKSLWKFLDQKHYRPKLQFVSEHHDELVRVDRDYGNAKKPEDYIESFKSYIEKNQNEITAIKMICSRPSELDRKSLKELKLLLDHEGFTESNLNYAWKTAKNQDIAADIIAFIRTMALGTDLISKDERIQKAMDKIKQSREWNKTQLKWLNRFEEQLRAETILRKEDLDKEPFKDEGGFNRLNKMFGNNLESLIKTINTEIFSA